MANFTVPYYKAGIAGFILIICITSITNASGTNEIHNAAKENAAENVVQSSNSGQHTIYCNGTWCVLNEEYCDKNKCIGCQYTKPDCTPHLDCLRYCIEKGVEQAFHEIAGTVTEENSTPAWSLPLFVVFLLLFLVSCVGHIVCFVLYRRRRKDTKRIITTVEETLLKEETGNDEATEPKPVEKETITKIPVQEETSKSNTESHEFN